MEYTIKGLADLAGVSTRTLRWYDRKGLLKPSGVTKAGYRLYDEEAVARLQQIMFYRELEISLSEIGRILDNPGFDRQKALESHLAELKKRRDRIDALLLTGSKTLEEMRGGAKMTDQEKFEAFKAERLHENEVKYGKEIRAKYGAEAERVNASFLKLTQEEYAEWDALSKEVIALLEQAVRSGESPHGPEGRRIAALHQKWCSSALGNYDEDRYAGIVELYIIDERFTAYYDRRVEGCAKFLRDAVLSFLGRLH